MALVVTFTRADRIPGTTIPVEVADEARTERIAIDSGSDGLDYSVGGLSAADTENIVSIYAETSCWVKVGLSPEARPGEGRLLAAGERMQLLVKVGHKVAVTGVEVS